MYRVRFHLANGPHFMHWQIKDMETGNVEYVDPQKYSLWLTNCKLKNNKKIARQIRDGADKTVCAWIECASWRIESDAFTCDFLFERTDIEHLQYNPRKAPYWNLLGCDIDNVRCDELITRKSKVYHINNG